VKNIYSSFKDIQSRIEMAKKLFMEKRNCSLVNWIWK